MTFCCFSQALSVIGAQRAARGAVAPGVAIARGSHLPPERDTGQGGGREASRGSLRSQALHAGGGGEAGQGREPARARPEPAPAGPAPLRRRCVPARSRCCGRSAAVSAARRKEGGARPALFGSGGALRAAGSCGHGGPQVLPVDLGAVPLPQPGAEGASGELGLERRCLTRARPGGVLAGPSAGQGRGTSARASALGGPAGPSPSPAGSPAAQGAAAAQRDLSFGAAESAGTALGDRWRAAVPGARGWGPAMVSAVPDPECAVPPGSCRLPARGRARFAPSLCVPSAPRCCLSTRRPRSHGEPEVRVYSLLGSEKLQLLTANGVAMTRDRFYSSVVFPSCCLLGQFVLAAKPGSMFKPGKRKP